MRLVAARLQVRQGQHFTALVIVVAQGAGDPHRAHTWEPCTCSCSTQIFASLNTFNCTKGWHSLTLTSSLGSTSWLFHLCANACFYWGLKGVVPKATPEIAG